MQVDKKRIIGLSILTTVLSLGMLLGWHWYTGRYLVATDDAYVQADVTDIRPEIPGRIIQVLVQDNQFIRKGQQLVQIDPTDFRTRAQRAHAQLDIAKAAKAEVTEQISLQGKRVEAAQADIAAARAQDHRAKLELKRAQALARQAYGSKQRLETAQANAKVAKSRLLQAQAAFAAEQQRLSVLLAKLNSTQARIKAARANASYAANQLCKTRIVAPQDGVIGDLSARVGSMATPALSLLRLVPIPNVYITANYKETQIGHISIGQAAVIRVDAFPDIPFQGVVTSLAPATGTEFSLLPQDNATGNFNKIVQRVPVRIRVTGPKDALTRLRPGLSVVTKINTQRFDARLSYLNDSPGLTAANDTSARVGSP